MNNYQFTIAIRDADVNDWEMLETALFEAGCDDALLSSENSLVTLDFDRLAENANVAIYSALADINKAGFHDLVVQETGLCTLSDMAKRAGLTRQAMSLYALNKRGNGGFPKPLYSGKIYSWREVATWLYQQGKVSKPTYEVACVTV